MKAGKTLLAFILASLIVLQATLLTVMGAYEVLESETCFGYRLDTLGPKGVGDAFLTHNEKVGYWIKINDPPTDLSMRVIWSDPDGITYDNNAVDVTQLDGEEWGIVFDSIYIDGTSAANKKGVWTVEFSIEGTVEASKQFQILDYDEIISTFSDLREQLNEIQATNDETQETNQALLEQLAELQADYNDLLENPPNSEALDELQDQYSELYEDYRDIQVNLSTTKMMMYGAVVVAIASVAIAVYFGAIKRS
jgi:hypothetical protein